MTSNNKMTNAASANQNVVTSRIVHESEAQRQHVRIKISAIIRSENEKYEMANLSSGGFAIKVGKSPTKELGASEFAVILPFTAFCMKFTVNAREIYFDKEKGIAGFQFCSLSPPQISLINYLIKAFLAGHIVTEGDIIGIISRNNFTEERNKNLKKHKPGNFKQAGRILPVLLILCAGVAGLLFLYGNMYKNPSLIESWQGRVSSEEITVRSQTTGIFRPLLEEGTSQVAEGQPLATLEPVSISTDNSVSKTPQGIIVKSPCDCVILKTLVRKGEFRRTGEPIFKLTPIEEMPVITTLLSTRDALEIRPQDDVNINIAGESSSIAGYVDSISEAGHIDSSLAQVVVRPARRLPLGAVGLPAHLEFLRR